jgi:hypothetical protein
MSRTITPEELKSILDAHAKWRCGEDGGSRANLADACLAGADLTDADLADACLAGADLTDADLTDAYLAGADLTDADLTDADLTRANLTDADLAGAYLAGADLAGANLAGADLAGANYDPAKSPPPPDGKPKTPAERAARFRALHPEVPAVEHLDRKILDAITSGGGSLDMSQWHTCETTHCRAGWAITLAGEKGKELEAQHGPYRAGAMIYRASTGRVPHLYATTERAMADIRKRAEESP